MDTANGSAAQGVAAAGGGGVLGCFGASETYAEFAIEYALIFLVLVPLTGGALASVTTYQFQRLYVCE